MCFSYLSLCVFPWTIDEIDREHLNAQPPLNAIHHDLQAFTVPDYKTGVIQFVCHLFEVQVGILGFRQKTQVKPHSPLKQKLLFVALHFI